MRFEVFEHDRGFGYRILEGDNCFIFQEFAPGAEGDTPMTGEDAERFASETISRLTIA